MSIINYQLSFFERNQCTKSQDTKAKLFSTIDYIDIYSLKKYQSWDTWMDSI